MVSTLHITTFLQANRLWHRRFRTSHPSPISVPESQWVVQGAPQQRPRPGGLT